MKHIWKITFLLAVKLSNAQFQEFNFGVGTATYIGDLSPTHNSKNPLEMINYDNMKLGYTVGYRYNFPQYLNLGLNATYMQVSAYDSDNDPNDIRSAARRYRNLSFHSSIFEINAMVGFEPFRNEYRWNSGNLLFSPIISAGVGVFWFNPKAYRANGEEVELKPLRTEGQGLTGGPAEYSTTSFSIPVGLGLKVYGPERKISLALEAVYRYTNTDYLDDVSTVYYKNYPSSADYNLSREMSDRSQELGGGNANGDKRGTSTYKDVFLTFQAKLALYFGARRSGDYDCYIVK